MIEIERRPVPLVVHAPIVMANTDTGMANTMANSDESMANSTQPMANTSTYQYRDPTRRKEYMRAYMAQRRA